MDDALAFLGGLDLTRCRWDTPEHRADDPRRVNVNGAPYQPFHDVQMMVDGEAAAVLGELARERWRRATGEELHRTPADAGDPWPLEATPAMTRVEVTIARTEPAFEGRPAVREVERTYLDAIAAARHCLYIENQYLTSRSVTEALAARLQAEQGPEIVVVLPRKTDGWLEQATMDVLRGRVLRQLREADRHGRLRIYYPDVPGLEENQQVIVHAKLLVADNALVRVGSANLSNRSMGLDSECDLVIAARGREDLEQAIIDFRNRLLGEHLGVEPGAVAAAIQRTASLIGAIESLGGGPRTLRDLHGAVPEALDKLVPEASLIDPEKPLDLEHLTAQILPAENRDEEKTPGARYWIKGLVLLGLFLGLAAAWRWTPLGEWLDADALAARAQALGRSPLGPLAVLAAFAIGSVTAFPITVLIVVTALVFGPVLGFVYALVGTLAGAVLTYAIGHRMGRDIIRRFAGSRLNRVSRQLGQRGALAVAVVRVVPVAPFTVVNLVAGASHIRFRDFFLGTLLGMGPGMLALTVFADGLYQAFRDPQPATLAWVAGVLLVAGTLLAVAQRWLTRRGRQTATDDPNRGQ
jgi:uncharacterized membrane protein YdjX (TVP38/TMEM64 family)